MLITAGPETLAVMLQPTALGRTLLRIGLLGASAPEASLATWLAEIAARTRAAEAAQAALSGAPDGEARLEANEAGFWLQARIAEAVRARPRHETIPPLYATAQGHGC